MSKHNLVIKLKIYLFEYDKFLINIANNLKYNYMLPEISEHNTKPYINSFQSSTKRGYKNQLKDGSKFRPLKTIDDNNSDNKYV